MEIGRRPRSVWKRVLETMRRSTKAAMARVVSVCRIGVARRLFYASASACRLAAELDRLMCVELGEDAISSA